MKDRNIIYKDILGIKKNCDYTMFHLLQLSSDKDCVAFEKKALENGVQVFAVNRFYASSDSKLNAVRVSLCSTNDIDSLKSGLKIFKEML